MVIMERRGERLVSTILEAPPRSIRFDKTGLPAYLGIVLVSVLLLGTDTLTMAALIRKALN